MRSLTGDRPTFIAVIV